VSLGADRFHVEAVVDVEQGDLLIHLYGEDAVRVVTAPARSYSVYVRRPGRLEAELWLMQPWPQPEDPAGQASRFRAPLGAAWRTAESLEVTIPAIRLGGERWAVRFRLDAPAGAHAAASADGHEAELEALPAMPGGVADDAARELYLTPGGEYTLEDIRANRRQLAADVYRGFRARHDLHPGPDDALCPITRTKANPECTWVIGGERVAFCCPPCIDEYLGAVKRGAGGEEAPPAEAK
jgi:hypothetical protein